MKAERKLALVRGSSITEFLIAAPALALLVYVAMDLNQTIAYKQGLHIAARNNAYLDTHAGGASADRLNGGTREDLSAFLGPEDEVETPGTGGEVRETKGYDETVHGFGIDRVGKALDGQASTSDTAYERISATFGFIARWGSAALDTATDFVNVFGVLGDAWIIPPAKVRSGKASLSIDGTAGLLRRTLAYSSAEAEGQGGAGERDQHLEKVADTLKREMSAVHVVRPETGYHPHGYVIQGVMGFALGTAIEGARPWPSNGGSPSGPLLHYNSQCLMNFDRGGKKCTDYNTFNQAIIWLGRAIQAAITLSQLLVVTAPAGIAAEIAQQVVIALVEEALGTAMDEIGEAVTGAIEEKLIEMLNGHSPLEVLGEAAFAKALELIENPDFDLSAFAIQKTPDP